MSALRQATQRFDSFTGAGYRPSATPAHQWDRLTGTCANTEGKRHRAMSGFWGEGRAPAGVVALMRVDAPGSWVILFTAPSRRMLVNELRLCAPTLGFLFLDAFLLRRSGSPSSESPSSSLAATAGASPLVSFPSQSTSALAPPPPCSGNPLEIDKRLASIGREWRRSTMPATD